MVEMMLLVSIISTIEDTIVEMISLSSAPPCRGTSICIPCFVRFDSWLPLLGVCRMFPLSLGALDRNFKKSLLLNPIHVKSSHMHSIYTLFFLIL